MEEINEEKRRSKEEMKKEAEAKRRENIEYHKKVIKKALDWCGCPEDMKESYRILKNKYKIKIDPEVEKKITEHYYKRGGEYAHIGGIYRVLLPLKERLENKLSFAKETGDEELAEKIRKKMESLE